MTKGNDQYPDVKQVRDAARDEWFQRQHGMLSIQERIDRSIPWWILIFAGVFFLLSIPHTMNVFDQITPTWGKAAPLAIEFGLLYGSFTRKKARRWSWQLILFEVFLFVIAVIVNGAGSFAAAVKTAPGMDQMSLMELWNQYPSLPALNQIALLLVPLAALIIPIGTVVAGDGLAALALERRDSGNLIEQQWVKECPMVEFEALRDAAIAEGITPGRATRWAESIAFYQGPDTGGQNRPVSAADNSGQHTDTSGRTDYEGPDGGGHGTGQGYTKQMDARTRVRAFLSENPEAADYSVRQLADAAGVGKTTAADELNDWKASRNGQDHA